MERAREHVGLVEGNGLSRRGGEEEKDVAGWEGRVDGGGGGGEGGGGGGGGDGDEVGGSVAEGIRSLIRATWEDVKAWCDEEAEARVRRKDAQVSVDFIYIYFPLSVFFFFSCSLFKKKEKNPTPRTNGVCIMTTSSTAIEYGDECI